MKIETTNITSLTLSLVSGRNSNTGDCAAQVVIETFTLPIGKMIVKLGGSLIQMVV